MLRQGNHPSRQLIARAARHEARLKLFGTAYESEAEARMGGADIDECKREWAATLQKPEKYQQSLQMLKWPLPTVAFCDGLWAVLEKALQGVDPVMRYEFTTERAAQQDAEFRKLNPPMQSLKKLFDTVKGGMVNVLQVTDLPGAQQTERPRPYTYLRPVSSLAGYGFDRHARTMDWAAWKETPETLAWFDRYSYRVYPTKKDSLEIIGEASVDTPHGLTWPNGDPKCPVEFAWADELDPTVPEIRESPVSKLAGEMFWLLWYEVCKHANDLIALFPIYWGDTPECKYVDTNEEEGIHVECSGGILRTGSGAWLFNEDGSNRKCPKCGTRRLIGPGTFVEKLVKGNDDDRADGNAPVGVIPAEVNSVKAVRDELEAMRRRMTVGVTGAEPNALNNQAANERQIEKVVDGMVQAVRNFQHNLERALEWSENNRCQLTYGQEFASFNCSLGTRYIFLSANDLLDAYERRRREGADDIVLDRLWADWQDCRYRQDPGQLARERLLAAIDPFRHRTPEQAAAMAGADPLLVYLKSNFSTLVARFERENGDVAGYAAVLDMDTRVRMITTIILSYVKEQYAAPTAAGGGSTTNANAAGG